MERNAIYIKVIALNLNKLFLLKIIYIAKSNQNIIDC